MASNLLEMKVNAHLAQECSKRTDLVSQFLGDLEILNIEVIKEKVVVQKILDGIKPIIKEIEGSAFLKSNRKAAQISYKEYITKVQGTLTETNRINQEISAITVEAKKKLSTPVETYILIDDDGNQQQIHRIKEEV